MTKLNKEETAKISGGADPAELKAGMAYREAPPKSVAGMPNPVSGMSFEDAMKKAGELGSERKDMGGWYQMNDTDFLKWWASSNPSEYEAHKSEIDTIIGANK